MAKTDLTAARLRELLDYDPETGIFIWRISRRVVRAGSVAGSLRRNGYIKVHVEGRGYYAHRLAWFYVYGAWPADELDHINRIKDDNRIANLREVTRGQNGQNTSMHCRNRSGFKGVAWQKRDRRWSAQIMVNGKNHYLGYFDSPEAASDAYQAAAAVLHTHIPIFAPATPAS